MILYNIQRGPRGFLIAKFDDDFNVAAVYNVNPTFCDCPAGPRPTCRHRKMLPKMLAKVDTGEFYCYETATWHQPLGDLLRPEAGDLEGREAMPDAPGHTDLMVSPEAIEEVLAGAAVGVEPQVNANTVELTGLQEEQISMGFHQPELCSPPMAKPSPAPTIRRR